MKVEDEKYGWFDDNSIVFLIIFGCPILFALFVVCMIILERIQGGS